MDIALSIILLFFFTYIAYWAKKRDESKHGKLASRDKRNTLIATAIILVVMLLMSKLCLPAYFVIVAIFGGYSLIFGGGTGKHGWYRQIRDGGIIATIISTPFVFAMGDLV